MYKLIFYSLDNLMTLFFQFFKYFKYLFAFLCYLRSDIYFSTPEKRDLMFKKWISNFTFYAYYIKNNIMMALFMFLI